ncbi:hypothetical protein [Chitinibacter sp. S2-10]|uniref:hypothetical protein n=1 Tax=Chitinibacter sp. S2-10 TaxID=3373597 RepID=UPI0039776B82
MFKKIRVTILLMILLSVALSAWRTQDKAAEWKVGQYVYLYPVDTGVDEYTSEYIKSINGDSWQGMQQFFSREAEAYGLKLSTPIRVMAGPPISVAPPAMPSKPSMLATMWWSLQLRWWAWRHTPETAVKPDARIYLLYHEGEPGAVLPHSIGIAKARLGLANLFATSAMEGSNQVVIAHELLHIYGANDHYDRASNQPIFPQGFAEPEQVPLYPQSKAELMAGRIALDENRSVIPVSLDEVLIGETSARAIGWIKQPDN